MMDRMNGLSVTVHPHIDDVAHRDWDALVQPEDLQTSRGFIRVCQDSGVAGAEYRHVIFRDADGPVCIATLSRMNVAPDLLARWTSRKLVARVRRHRQDFLRIPVLFCGLPVSFGNSCLRFRPGFDGARLIPSLDDVVRRVAREVKARLICYKEFTDEEARPLEGLDRLGYFRAPSLPGCVLRMKWDSFETYVGAMRAGYRRQLRQDLRVRASACVEVRVLPDYKAFARAIFALYERVMDRAEFQLERLNLEFFLHLICQLGHQTRAITIERRGEILAAAILLHTPRRLTFLLAGIDYSCHRVYRTYPNLIIEVIREAIRLGVERIELGQTSYDLKRRLGGEANPRHIYLKHRRPVSHRIFQGLSPILFPSRTYPARNVFRA
ncbi:MAG: GNAT family N-acetyltransferase [Planctomycetota bacterium]|nr:GNAT family N-acetyltransferase [Planctomycetota bacterium]